MFQIQYIQYRKSPFWDLPRLSRTVSDFFRVIHFSNFHLNLKSSLKLYSHGI